MESTASCRIIFVPRDDVVVIAITRWQSSLLHSHPSYLTPTVMRFAGTGFLKSRLWKADADFRGGLPLVCFFYRHGFSFAIDPYPANLRSAFAVRQ